MKKLTILCGVLAFALAISIGAQFVSKAWLDTTFRAAESATITIDDKSYELPLIANTSVRYKTSDSSYVLISRCRFFELKQFYDGEDGPEALTFTLNGTEFELKRLADDLKYVEYAVEAKG